VQVHAVPIGHFLLDIVDRIEILRDGGAAIYGSDAIAGVVNIIFRERFRGVSLNASYATTEYGDGKTPRASLTAGLGDPDADRYNVLFNIEASNHGALYASTRSDRRWIGSGDLRPYGYAFTAGGIGPTIGGWFNNETGVSNPNRYGAVSPTGLTAPVWQQPPGCESRLALPAGYGGCPYDRVAQTGVIEPSERKLSVHLRAALQSAGPINPYIELSRFESDVKSPWVFGPHREILLRAATAADHDHSGYAQCEARRRAPNHSSPLARASLQRCVVECSPVFQPQLLCDQVLGLGQSGR
jgi:iron complex outermembrane receptor protein